MYVHSHPCLNLYQILQMLDRIILDHTELGCWNRIQTSSSRMIQYTCIHTNCIHWLECLTIYTCIENLTQCSICKTSLQTVNSRITIVCVFTCIYALYLYLPFFPIWGAHGGLYHLKHSRNSKTRIINF